METQVASIKTQDKALAIKKYLVKRLSESGKDCEVTKEVKSLYLEVLKSNVLCLTT
jgi:hypothetical protein